MWEILSGVGALATIATFVVMLKGTPREWKIWDRIKKSAGADQVLVLLAQLEFDIHGRWTGAISDEIAKVKKRQLILGRSVKMKINKEGQMTIDEGIETLKKHNCDVLIAGRVGADGQSAVVKVINKYDGIIDEVTLEGEKKDKKRIEQIARLNLAIEEGIARNMDREGILGEESDKSLLALELAKERMHKFEEQAIHPRSEKYAKINKAALNIRTGIEGGKKQDLQEAREAMKIALNQEWNNRESDSSALQVANTLVFEARIERKKEKMQEGREWYKRAARQAERTGEYKQWIEAHDGATWTAVEIYLSTGEKGWLETARTEQKWSVELCKQRLKETDYKEARGIMAAVNLLIASLEGDDEGIVEAAEEVKEEGMYELFAELSGVGGSAQIRKLLTYPVEEEVKQWSRESEQIDKEAQPQSWALMQNRKGVALAEIAEKSGNIVQLLEGERAVRNALSIWTEDRWPQQYALAMDNLGLILAAKYSLTGKKKLLKQAVRSNKEAIKYRTKEDAPREWISTVRNMGRSLIALAEAYKNREIAKEAVDILAEAKEECIRLDDKLLEKEVTLNLGLAFDILAELTGRTDYLIEAIKNLEVVLERTITTIDLVRQRGIERRIVELKRRKK